MEAIYDGVSFPQSEIMGIALNIAGKKYYESSRNFVISQEIHDLVTEIFDSIYETYRIDFRNNLELYMMLVKHLIPLSLRLRHGNMIKNPILDEVMVEYPFTFSIASGINYLFEKYYAKRLSKDELGYIAIVFQLGIERNKKQENNKRNIVLVCTSGNVFSRFFKFRFQENFKDWIGEANTCDYQDLGEYDFSGVDCVFSTVPVDIELPVPVYQVDYYPDEEEIDNIRKVLKKSGNILEKYFSEQLFTADMEAADKTEVIRQMCDRIREVKHVPEEFYELVMKRESLLQTAMGWRVAVPHPYRSVTEETIISVAVLNKPIVWNDSDKVQVIFLIAVSDKDKVNLEKFYEEFFKLALTKENIVRLIKEPTYVNLIHILGER